MENKTFITMIIAVLIVVGVAVLVMIKQPAPPEVGLQTGIYNNFSKCFSFSTTTLANLPVKLLEFNPNRQYSSIVNDSSTNLYITLATSTFTPASASTTVVSSGGIRLNSGGGAYEILPENMTWNEVWVATSTAGQRILIQDCPGV